MDHLCNNISIEVCPRADRVEDDIRATADEFRHIISELGSGGSITVKSGFWLDNEPEATLVLEHSFNLPEYDTYIYKILLWAITRAAVQKQESIFIRFNGESFVIYTSESPSVVDDELRKYARFETQEANKALD